MVLMAAVNVSFIGSSKAVVKSRMSQSFMQQSRFYKKKILQRGILITTNFDISFVNGLLI